MKTTDITVIIIKGSPSHFKVQNKLGALGKDILMVDYTSIGNDETIEEIFADSKMAIDLYIEKQDEKDTSYTNPNFWDCECEKNHIHPKSLKICPICKSDQEEMPDSIRTEIKNE